MNNWGIIVKPMIQIRPNGERISCRGSLGIESHWPTVTQTVKITTR